MTRRSVCWIRILTRTSVPAISLILLAACEPEPPGQTAGERPQVVFSNHMIIQRGPIELPPLPGDNRSEARAINETLPPQIVGMSYGQSGMTAVVWKFDHRGNPIPQPLPRMVDPTPEVYRPRNVFRWWSTDAVDINDEGVITGNVFSTNTEMVVPMIWRPDGPTYTAATVGGALGDLFLNGQAMGIDDDGRIVGSRHNGGALGFVRELDGEIVAHATIKEWNAIRSVFFAGIKYNENDPLLPILSALGPSVVLDVLGGNKEATIWDMEQVSRSQPGPGSLPPEGQTGSDSDNDEGDGDLSRGWRVAIVGSSAYGDELSGSRHAVLWDVWGEGDVEPRNSIQDAENQLTDLGTLPWTPPDVNIPELLDQPTIPSPLPPGISSKPAPSLNSRALGLNVSRVVVGDSGNFFSRHAFVWTEEAGLKDLNSFLDPDSNWVFTAGWDVNGRNEIVGSALHGGKRRGFFYRWGQDPAVSMTKSAPETVLAGTEITYTFHVINSEPNPVTMKIVDTLPAHTQFPAEANPGWTIEQERILIFDLGPVPAGSMTDVHLLLQVDGDAGPDIVNRYYKLETATGYEETSTDLIVTHVNTLECAITLHGSKSCFLEGQVPPVNFWATSNDPVSGIQNARLRASLDGGVPTDLTPLEAPAFEYEWPDPQTGDHRFWIEAENADGLPCRSNDLFLEVTGEGRRPPSSYTVTWLPVFNASGTGRAYDINESGIIVGRDGSDDGEPVKWHKADGTYVVAPLATGPGTSGVGAAYSVNDFGQIAGWIEGEGFGDPRGAVWLDGVSPTYIDPPGQPEVMAMTINNLGQVLVRHRDPDAPVQSRYRIWISALSVFNPWIDVDVPGASSYGREYDGVRRMNDSGQVALRAQLDPDASFRGYLWTYDEPPALLTDPNVAGAAWTVNNDSTVGIQTGNAQAGRLVRVAEDGTRIEFPQGYHPNVTVVSDINARGDMAGHMLGSNGLDIGFIRFVTICEELIDVGCHSHVYNDPIYLPPCVPLLLEDGTELAPSEAAGAALGINDAGLIVGYVHSESTLKPAVFTPND